MSPMIIAFAVEAGLLAAAIVAIALTIFDVLKARKRTKVSESAADASPFLAMNCSDVPRKTPQDARGLT